MRLAPVKLTDCPDAQEYVAAADDINDNVDALLLYMPRQNVTDWDEAAAEQEMCMYAVENEITPGEYTGKNVSVPFAIPLP